MYFGYGTPMIYWNPGMLLLIPALIITIVAQARISSTYSKYSAVPSSAGVTGANAAVRVLSRAGIDYISVQPVRGRLTDHFHPKKQTIGLSEGVYDSTSIAAIAIAAHEAGHAMQHDDGYKPLAFRNALAPVTNFASRLAVPLIILGMLLGLAQLTQIAAIAFGVVLVFQLATLPVEFNASRRALAALDSAGLLTETEYKQAQSVLRAAALTYVAAALVALAQFLRFFFASRRR